MGGEGSMSSMNTILKNNRQLLKKKRMFSKEGSAIYKKDSKEFKKETYQAHTLSKEALQALKTKNRKQYLQTQRIRWAAGIVLFVCISFLGVQLFHVLKEQHTVSPKEQQQLNIFYNHLNSGDSYATQSKWNKAIVKYQEAIALYPHKYIGYSRLLYAYTTNCTTQQKYCKEAKELIDQMYDNHPENRKELSNAYSDVISFESK